MSMMKFLNRIWTSISIFTKPLIIVQEIIFTYVEQKNREQFLVKFIELTVLPRQFQWDPSITTPPGLYFVTHLLEVTLASLQLFKDYLVPCSLGLARFTNVIFLLLLPFVIIQYLKKTKRDNDEVKDARIFF